MSLQKKYRCSTPNPHYAPTNQTSTDPPIDVVRCCLIIEVDERAAVCLLDSCAMRQGCALIVCGILRSDNYGQTGDCWSRLKFLSFSSIAQYQCIANYVHANASIYLLSEHFSSATVRLVNFIITNHDATTLAKLSSPITLTLGSLLASCSSFSVTYPQEQR